MTSDNGPTVPSSTKAPDDVEIGEENGDETLSRPHEVVRLIDPHSSGEPDDEPELIADDVPAVGLASPEEAAMHIESDGDDHRPVR